ncbi:MAG: hypothetical protein QG594_2452 [Bacteroidota bacterium]|nr:hypothetical protein [Bacteroidota bacterium]
MYICNIVALTIYIIIMKSIFIFLILVLPVGLFAQNKPTEFSKKESETKLFATLEQDVPKEIVRIMKSGNGCSIETAFEVYTIEEEYKLLRFLKLTPIIQKLEVKDGVFYDSFKIDSRTIYFKMLSKTKRPRHNPFNT